MDLSRLNPLPEWNAAFLQHPEEAGEGWKHREALAAAEALYHQWREVFGLVMAFAENLPEEAGNALSGAGLLYENAFFIAPKIISAAGDTLYQIKMENAALIRFHARQMMEQMQLAVLMGTADEAHYRVIGEAMQVFKARFRDWVATFRTDGFPDEWGLFGQPEDAV